MTEVIVPLAQVFVSPEDEDELGWQDQALCAQTDPEAFFPEKGGSTREAKRVCRSCEVRAECLEYAPHWVSPGCVSLVLRERRG